MQIEPSENSKKKHFSHPINIDKENIICKEGFCSISNQNEKPQVNRVDGNLFDPI